MPDGCLNPQEVAQFLLEELPIYEPMIIRDVTPTDGWIGHVSVGQWDPFDGTQHILDRFRDVQPDVTKKWLDVSNQSCLGGDAAPCDPPENFIGWGSTRITYGQQRQSWRSQLLCFDQVLTVNKAQQHIEQIVSDILRPATSRIASQYLRKSAAAIAGTKWLASAGMTPFTFSWETTGDAEIFMTTSGEPSSKITPQMLQRRVQPLRNIGYFGKWTNDPFFGGYDSMIELVTDDDTAWDLDKVAQDLKVSQAWRFNMWDAAHDYYKYGIGGQLGNYMIRIDPFPIRFNKVSTNRFQIVLPYINEAATTGIGRANNPDWFTAQYQWSFIHHRMAMKVMVQRMEQVNALMPFAVRDLSGQWRFAINDLGIDCNGNPIANYRGNKGFFYADFQYATEPYYVEWEELIFHKREPAFVVEVDTCQADPGSPTQYYNSANSTCGDALEFTPTAGPDGHFRIAANSVTCSDNVVTALAIDAATVAALVTALNASAGLGALGTWIQNGSNILLTDTECTSVDIPWVYRTVLTPIADGDGNYVLNPDTVLCNGVNIPNGAISATSVALLATAMTADSALAGLGTWTASGSTIIFVGDCQTIVTPWVT